MNQPYDWEPSEDAYRFNDRDEPEHEPVVHARADVDARTFPCGVDARAMVECGDGTDITCEGCNAELQRRENLKRIVWRTAAALVYALGHMGRSRATLISAFRDAVNAGDIAAVGRMSTDVYALAMDLFWLHRQQHVAEAFINAVDAAGLRRTAGSIEDAFKAIDRLNAGDEEKCPF